jgi:hypothetical protein
MRRKSPLDIFRHVSEGAAIISNMRSDTEALAEALDAIEAGCQAVGVFPLETLSRTDGQALLTRLDKVDQKLVALQRSLKGRLIMTAPRVSA